MSQSRFSLLIGALALAALTVGGSGAARAAAIEVDFGSITPSSGLGPSPACTNTPGDAGYVCGPNQTFTASDGDVLTANGYTGTSANPFATQENLTWKNFNVPGVSPANSLGESGLGENDAGPGNACDDPVADPTVCEAGPNRSVTVSSSNDPILDIVIGSVQVDAEQFELFGATTAGGTLTALFGGTVFNSSNCPDYDGTTCTFDLTGGPYFEVGLADLQSENSSNPSDSLIVSVSVPAPPIGHGLLLFLAVGGLLFGGKLYERNTRQRSLGVAVPHAAG